MPDYPLMLAAVANTSGMHLQGSGLESVGRAVTRTTSVDSHRHDTSFALTVGTPEQNGRFLEALAAETA